MTTIKQLIGLMAIAGLFTACQNGQTSISGTASGTDQLHLVEVEGQKADTVNVFDLNGEDAEFSADLQVDTMKLFFLYVDGQFNIPLLVNPGDQIQLEIDATAERGIYEVTGSRESERIKEIIAETETAMTKVDSLSTLLQEAQESENFAERRSELNAAYEEIMENSAQRLKAMIDEDPQSMAHIFIFTQSVGNNAIVSPQDNFEYLEKVANGIRESYPGHSITENFNQNVDKLRKQVAQQQKMDDVQKDVGPGTPVPEIALPTPDGDTKKLSDLRGKIVLVDFWAAWCKPCRIENPNLVRIYNQYKDEGFTVYSVSLDGLPQQQNPKQQWVQAIEQDELTWENHVSDLQGWNSSVVPQFGFQGIPYTVLVDRDGTIIETNLRGRALENKLKEVLGQS